MKKEYYGNHLGMVINSSDPEYRGRVQVFVPHIMPALYEGWNKEGADIKISCVGSNIPEGLTPEIHARLVKILPWAESASPIIGASAPGNLFSDIVSGVKSAAETVGNLFVQTPTGNPVPPSGVGGIDLNNSAKGSIGLSTADIPGTQGGNVGCAAGVSLMFNKATGQDIIPGRKIVLGTSELYSHMSTSKDYVSVPANQAQPGDIIVTASGSKPGHTGIVTDGGRIISNSSSGFKGSERGTIQNNYSLDSWNTSITPRNPRQTGIFRYVGATRATNNPNSPAQSNPSSNETGANSTQPGPNFLAKKEGASATQDAAPVPQSGVSAGGQGISGTVSGGGTTTTGNSKLASDRQTRFGTENQEATMARLQVLASREVGNNPAAIQAFTESVVNRAYFSNRSLDKVLYESGYGFTDKTTATPSPAVREAFNKVMGGSNMTNLATDAGFNLPNSGRGRGGLFITGMQSKDYVITGAIDNATGKQITDPDLLNKLYTEGDKSGKYEFFVRQSRATSAEGIEKYAQENGIKSDGFQSDILPTLDATSTSVVNNTDGNGRTPVVNTNDMPSGMFAYPNPGAMVWVFFREGNPLYPVYFAASYSAAEWKGAYRGGSEGEMYEHEKPGVKVTTNVTKPNSAGGTITKSRVNINDPLDNESVFSLFHQHGSNITFKDGCDFHYSRNNKRDEVESDRFIITRGYKEQWIEGDESTNVRGNVIIKVGKIDAESIKAAQDLSDFSYELNQTLMSKK